MVRTVRGAHVRGVRQPVHLRAAAAPAGALTPGSSGRCTTSSAPDGRFAAPAHLQRAASRRAGRAGQGGCFLPAWLLQSALLAGHVRAGRAARDSDARPALRRASRATDGAGRPGRALLLPRPLPARAGRQRRRPVDLCSGRRSAFRHQQSSCLLMLCSLSLGCCIVFTN